ncbi:PKD domain-containing protein [Haloarcula sp. S1AR25-5A]|uniref:PKD domain-containing protein n=1 Tax=Haloarcula terrestris TaxID=2950533 RepID=A0AAE4EVZ4_9EURY|nr:PKD domain-containing protein [Haloarcula terrestris]MDS0220484.1 PKD domain-containing protein [Haloarcula terrestris]
MHRISLLALSVLALSALLGGTAVATGNQPPLADAGLDQSVERGATVQLDANGSRDPDGTIERVEWTIEAPDGTTRTPDCPTCVQTTVSPTDTGQYNVTVTVTDDDGVSQSDTLRVDVAAAGGPSVSVSAPSALSTGSQRNLTANVTAGEADLRTLAWVVNGTARNRTQLAGENGSSTITHTFNDSGSVAVRAVAYDAAGRRGVSNQTVQIVSSGGGGSSSNSCPAGTINYYDSGNKNQGCTSAAMTIGDTTVDTDGRDGLWVYVDGELSQIIEEENMNRYSEDGRGETFTEETVDERKAAIGQKRQKANNDGGSGDNDDGSNDNDGGSSDDDSSSSGSTRPDSSVPNNLMDPDGGADDDDEDSSLPDGPSVEDDNAFDSSDDDGGLSDSGSDDNDDGSSSDDDSSSSDNDDGGLLGGLFDGGDDGSDDSGGSGDDGSSNNGGGGWSFW